MARKKTQKDRIEDPESAPISWIGVHLEDVTGPATMYEIRLGEGQAYLGRLISTFGYLAQVQGHSINENDPREIGQYALAISGKGNPLPEDGTADSIREYACSFLLRLIRNGILFRRSEDPNDSRYHLIYSPEVDETARKRAEAIAKGRKGGEASARSRAMKKAREGEPQHAATNESPKIQADMLTAPMVGAWNRTNRPAY